MSNSFEIKCCEGHCQRRGRRVSHPVACILLQRRNLGDSHRDLLLSTQALGPRCAYANHHPLRAPRIPWIKIIAPTTAAIIPNYTQLLSSSCTTLHRTHFKKNEKIVLCSGYNASASTCCDGATQRASDVTRNIVCGRHVVAGRFYVVLITILINAFTSEIRDGAARETYDDAE